MLFYFFLLQSPTCEGAGFIRIVTGETQLRYLPFAQYLNESYSPIKRMLVLCVALFILGSGVSHSQSGDTPTGFADQHIVEEALDSHSPLNRHEPDRDDEQEATSKPFTPGDPFVVPPGSIPQASGGPRRPPTWLTGPEWCKERPDWPACRELCTLYPQAPLCEMYNM